MVSDKTMPYLQRRPSRPNSLPRNWVGTRRMPPVLDLTQPAQGLKPSTFWPITIGVGSRCVLMRGSVAAMRKEQRSDGTTSGCDGDRRGGSGGTRDAVRRSMAAASGDDAVGTGDRRVSARIDAATPGTAEPGNLVSGSSAEVFFGQYRCPLIG